MSPRSAGFLAFLNLLAGPLVRAETAPADAAALMRAAVQSAQAGDFTAAVAGMEAAVAQRPGHPAYLYNLACMQALAGQSVAAINTLGQLAAWGLSAPAAQDGDFASLADNGRFQAVASRLTKNRAARGHAGVAFTLPAQTGVIEGIARRESTGEVFFGDMRARTIWRRNAAGAVTAFTAPNDRLAGLGGLAIDEARGLLWAAASAQEIMAGDAPAEPNGLAAFDLTTGELRHWYPVPADDAPHATVDLTLGPDGALYLSDSAAPVIWRLAPDGAALAEWFRDPNLRSLQGLAWSADGAVLYVADYTLGLFAIDPTTRTAKAVPARNNTLVCIDGLVRDGDRLIAVQNGVTPARVLAIAPDPAGGAAAVTELVAGLPAMRDATLGCVTGEGYWFIAHAGWDKFGRGGDPTAPHECPVLHVKF
ncbi:MAG: SMP-30/gluconolactonase/LRE family protein [Cephaloticoccus sp.]